MTADKPPVKKNKKKQKKNDENVNESALVEVEL